MSGYAISTQALAKRYGTQQALSELTLAGPVGEIFGLLGHNGAGLTITGARAENNVNSQSKAAVPYRLQFDLTNTTTGKKDTVSFDNRTGPGRYPDNRYSIYRNSTSQVTITAAATGEKVD